MRVIYIFVAVAAAACSKPTGQAGSCVRPRENICIDYPAAQAAAGKRLCTGLQWNATPCSAASRLGVCTKPDVTENYYSGPPNNYDAAGAKLACTNASGTWKP